MTIKWNTQADDLVCPICRPLHHKEWIFETDKDPFPKVLAHPLQGMVWDTLADHSLAHGSGSFNCRCFLTWEMNDVDLAKTVRAMTEKLRKVKVELEKHVK
jgi:hypothetical protein